MNLRRLRHIRVSPATIAMLATMLLTDRTGICLATVLAAFFHEGGHLLAAYVMKIPMREIRLDMLGARMEVRGRLISYGEEWLLCAAGPLFSLFGAALASLFWRWARFSKRFSCASLLLGLLNFMPIRTFDGGRMLETALSRLWGTTVADKIMGCISFFFLFLLWALAVYFLLRAGDGFSLFCFSVSLLSRFFESQKTA